MGKSTKPLLSIGMIVKNEIRSLEKCLKALEPIREAIPCELVIADTGSDDGTREIAARYADIFFDFPWINDFSAARNAVMDRSSGKWFISVDADEYLDPDILELVKFLKGPEAEKITFGAILVRNYATTDMGEDYTDCYGTRMLRMASNLRYEGAIHESLFIDPALGKKFFHHTILHHDGYALPTQAARTQKLKRNMKLLEKELERTPKDLRRLLQAIESSPDLDKKLKYIRRGLQVVKEKEAQWEMYGPAIYKHGLEVALDQNMTEFDTWLKEAKAWFPQAFQIRIDASFLALAKRYKAADYEGALREAELYWSGLRDADQSGEKQKNSVVSPLLYDTAYKQNQTRIIEADSLGRLKRYEEMRERLDAVEVTNCILSCLNDYIKLLYISWEKVDVSEILTRVYRELFETETVDAERQEAFRRQTAAAFHLPEDEEHSLPYPIIAKLPFDLGRAAMVMLAKTPEEVKEKASELLDWRDVPAIVVQKLMDLDVPLPPSFFRQGAERYEELAVEMAGRMEDEFAAKVLAYSRSEDFFDTATRFVWVLSLVIVAVREEKWKAEEQGDALCDLFAGLMGDCLSNFYNSELLNETDIAVLPGIHRFGWYLLQGRAALSMGDTVGYIQKLQAGLKTAPVMKKMVKFLLRRFEEGVPRVQPDPELLNLAEQIREKVEEMKKNGDPGLDELLSSPVYQKVAPLIDGIRGEKK